MRGKAKLFGSHTLSFSACDYSTLHASHFYLAYFYVTLEVHARTR